MTGIVKLPTEQVSSFDTVETAQKLAHRFFVTLRPVDNVVNSGTEFSTFNPFVVGSTPAGPTKFLNEIKHLEQSKCFFSAKKYITSKFYTIYAFWQSVLQVKSICDEVLPKNNRN